MLKKLMQDFYVIDSNIAQNFSFIVLLHACYSVNRIFSKLR